MGEYFGVLGESLIPENNSPSPEIQANKLEELEQRWEQNASSVIVIKLFFFVRLRRKDRELYDFERSFITVLV
jgi:hypothetical protein